MSQAGASSMTAKTVLVSRETQLVCIEWSTSLPQLEQLVLDTGKSALGRVCNAHSSRDTCFWI